jgi:hypothetical protein
MKCAGAGPLTPAPWCRHRPSPGPRDWLTPPSPARRVLARTEVASRRPGGGDRNRHHEHIGTDLQLGIRTVHVIGMGAGAAARDDRTGDAVGLQECRQAAQRLDGLRGSRRVENMLDVPRIALQAAEGETPVGRGLARKGVAVLQGGDSGAPLPVRRAVGRDGRPPVSGDTRLSRASRTALSASPLVRSSRGL